MRYFGTDKGQNNYIKMDQDTMRHGNDGDLTLRERGMIGYFKTHRQQYRVGTKQIVEENPESRRTIQRILSSLEEKGYLYRNEKNRHPITGPEFIVAETPELLQKVLESENLFEPTPEPEPADADDQQQTPNRPSVPEELLDGFMLGGQDWTEVPHPPRPALFARPPLRDRNDAREKMPESWRIYVSCHADHALGVPHVAQHYAPSFYGIPVCHIRHTGVPHVSYRCATYGTPIGEQLREQLRRTTKLHLLQSRRYSNVRRHRARALAELNSNYSASNRQKPPALDRSHNRRVLGMWIEMFDRKESHPYYGIRSYVEDDSPSLHKPTIKDDISIYWFNPDAEWKEGVLPTKPEEKPDITERPLADGAEPNKAHDVPERYAEVGVLSGKDDPHPHDRSHRSSAAIKAIGAEFFGEIEMSIRSEDHGPWPEPDPTPDRNLSFAGHRPDEQLPEVRRVSEHITSTEFIRQAFAAVQEALEEQRTGYMDGVPDEPSPIDHQRAEEYGKDPKRMMRLRQVAQVVISPHVFDEESSYSSPGSDPWPILMYEKLAFPETDLSVEAKTYIDEKVTQAHPSSPAEWANVLIMGIEQDWDPRWVKNFVKCYRHEMNIERDPSRSPAPGGPRTSKGAIRHGNGIDLSEGDPKEIIPPKNE